MYRNPFLVLIQSVLLMFVILVTGLSARPLFSFMKTDSATDSSKWIGINTLEMNGNASGFGGQNDEFIFAFGNLQGNFDISTRCVGIVDSSNQTEAGIMVRSDTLPVSRFCALVTLHERGTALRYRTSEGNNVVTVNLSSDVFNWLRIKRNGKRFEFFYRNYADSAWEKFSTAYNFTTFPSAVCAGIVHVSNTDRDIFTSSKFSDFGGFQEENQDLPCEPVFFDFESATPLDSLGFRNINGWVLDTNGYIRTNFCADSMDTAEILSPQFETELGADTITVSWDLYLAGDTSASLSDFSLFSIEEMVLSDRVKITGKRIGSATGTTVGYDDTIMGNIYSEGDIALLDRAIVTGDVQAGAACSLYTDASVTGTITENSVISIPVLPEKAVDTGTGNITVNPNDSMHVTPGNYSSLIAYGDSKISFEPGEYSFNSFTTEPQVRIYLQAGISDKIDINVLSSFHISDRTTMYISDTTAQNNITVYTHQADTVKFGTDLILFGRFLIPRGIAHITSRSCVIKGGLYARKIICEPDVNIIVNSRMEMDNRFEVCFFPVDTTEEQLQKFTYIIHGSMDKDSITDFILRNGNDTTVAVSFGEHTPVEENLNFEFKLFQGDTGILSRLLFNNSLGNYQIFDSTVFPVSSLSALKFQYYNNNLNWPLQARLDNILISCVQDTCPPLIIIKGPSDTTVYQYSTAVFACSVSAGGIVPTYQWYKNGVPVPWTNSSSFIMHNVDMADNESQVYCQIASSCDTVTTSAAVLNVDSCDIPQITCHPKNDTVMAGQTAEFSVTAQGTGLQYEWRCNDKIIQCWDSVYVINNVQPADNLSRYNVLVTNGCGKQNLSSYALLVVSDIEPCRLFLHPQSDTLVEEEIYHTRIQSVCPGGDITWFRNGMAEPGFTGTYYEFGPVTVSDNGTEIYCIVDNGVTADTSDTAVITVVSSADTRYSIAISGELFDGEGNKPGKDSIAEFYDFRVQLYALNRGGTALYTEMFKGISVRDGVFTVTLGKGKADNDLQEVVSSHKDLYAEIYAGYGGGMELLAPRLQLTAVPYAFTSGVKVVYGNGNPDSLDVSVPMGTMYVDKEDANSTWKCTNSGWIKLD